MIRVVVAAIMFAAVGLVGFNAPARAATNWNVAVLDGAFTNGTCGALEQGSVTSIMAGDSVTWTSCSDPPISHNVTSDDGKFAQKSLPTKGSTATQQFDTPGNYGYKCTIHKFTGTVVVEAPSTTVQTAPPTTPPTTAKPATTTSSTVKPATTTTVDIDGVFGNGPPSSTTSTTVDSTVTTRALGSGGVSGTSAGLVAALIVGLGAVGTAGALVIRRMRGGGVPPG
jgi:plastocyanin